MSRSHGSKDLQGMIIPGLNKAGESARSANVLSVRVCLLESTIRSTVGPAERHPQ
jgi:hypothetical protein